MDNKVIVKLEDFSKSFGDKEVIKKINLEIYEGEFFTFLGSSGCGKTTILRSISGLDQPTEGKVYIDDEDVTFLEPQKRKVNTIFQNYALFPLMTIYDNVAFGLRMKGVDEKEVDKKVKEMLSLVHLDGYEDRLPKDLSGGEQQRVAIIRGLINSPRVLLLDEPLSALDSKLRKEMQIDLKRLQKKLGTTFIYVTHSQDEALTMSDRICLLNKGHIQQLGTPNEMYETPSSMYTADFIGEINKFTCFVINKKILLDEYVLKYDNLKELNDKKVKVLVRPENIKITKTKKDNCLEAEVKEIIYDGATTKINLKSKSYTIKALIMGNDNKFNVGDSVYLSWDDEDALILE